MKPIEPARQNAAPDLTRRISDFWTRNVNAERLQGKVVSGHLRGTDEYFADLDTQRYRSHRHLLEWIHAMQPGRSVLEVGCGVGLDSAQMAQHGLQVTALDLTVIGAKTADERARRKDLDAAYLCASGEALPFADETFDYVYSFGVLHHASDTQACIDEVRRVLKPGGEARIMLYNRHSLNELAHRMMRIPFEERDELCPVVRRFSKAEIRTMFEHFKSVEVHADHAFGEGYGLVYSLTPRPLYRLLSRTVGWHLMISAVR